ncbi:hypothetical protein V1502_02485 [Bacillus sp. SCS-153A]|uniref:hypothetical protein n=1 Tax=Rossellomorea sedimentorum TaxID=3115294 RepID=UPI0039058773
MITVTLETLNETIEKNRKSANLTLRTASSSSGRRKKSRARAKGEVKCLDQISISRWKKAVQDGKIISLGNRKMYYDYN